MTPKSMPPAARNVFVHHMNTVNIGDLSSCPQDYFDLPGVRMNIDTLDLGVLAEAENIIVGGGGAFYFRQEMETLVSMPGRKIAWGIGCNAHGSTDTAIDLSAFDLVGCRDRGRDWVPCVSCMAGVYATTPFTTHEVVAYEHADRPLGLPLPTRTNSMPTMREAVEFLASGETVVTNSYHGAYWAILLGRRVALYGPLWSSKFYAMPWPVPVIGKLADVGQARCFATALSESRTANRRFAELVGLQAA